MTKRIFYYILGFTIGAVFIYFLLLRGKDYNFWVPGERVKTEFIVRKPIITDKAQCQLNCLAITDSLHHLINAAEVNFKDSRVHEKPCKFYLLEIVSQKLKMDFSQCDTIVTLVSISREGQECQCD